MIYTILSTIIHVDGQDIDEELLEVKDSQVICDTIEYFAIKPSLVLPSPFGAPSSTRTVSYTKSRTA